MRTEKRPEGRDAQPWPTGSMNPGDEAPEGTPGTGENVCPDCAGSGRVQNGRCNTCGGIGVVIVGIGGA